MQSAKRRAGHNDGPYWSFDELGVAEAEVADLDDAGEPPATSVKQQHEAEQEELGDAEVEGVDLGDA